MSDHIHIGPQGPLLEDLEGINSSYQLDLGFTKTFRWSPGYKKQIAERLIKMAGWDKPTCAPHRLFEKYPDTAYRVSNMKERILRVHDNLCRLRGEGMVWLEDPSVIFDKLDVIKNKISEELLMINKLKTLPINIDIDVAQKIYTNNNTAYHDDFVTQDSYEEVMSCDGEVTDYPDFYSGFKQHVILITLNMKDFPLHIFNTEMAKIASIQGSDISLQWLISVPRLLNQLQLKSLEQMSDNGTRSYYYNRSDHFSLLSRRGKYESEYNFLHPYINRRYSNGDIPWTGVCLGDLESGMRQNAIRLNLTALILQFQQWVTTYTVGHTNPLNQPNYMHFGMPEAYGTEYKNITGQSTEQCASKMMSEVQYKIRETDNNQIEGACMALCDTMKCSLRGLCGNYKQWSKEPEVELTDEQKALVKQMRTWASTAQRGGLNG